MIYLSFKQVHLHFPSTYIVHGLMILVGELVLYSSRCVVLLLHLTVFAFRFFFFLEANYSSHA